MKSLKPKKGKILPAGMAKIPINSKCLVDLVGVCSDSK